MKNLLLAVSVLFCFMVPPKAIKAGNNKKEQPNVLMICVDDLNNWLGCLNGHPNALTPNIDRLAESGVLFSNAHCQAPLCGPSRASIMLGLRPSTTGIYGQIEDNDINVDNYTTENVTFLPKYFQNNGYHTMGIGKIFHSHAPDGVFEESGGRVKGFGPLPKKRFKWEGKGTADSGSTSTDWGAFPEHDSLMPDVASANWTIERLNRNYDKPFFLAVGFLRPHVPWYVPQKWVDKFPIDSIVTPAFIPNDKNDVPEIALMMDELPMMPTTSWAIESGEWPYIVQSYLACISFVDFYVGEILNALQNSQYADNTIVVLWSDHGYRLGQKGTFAKHCLWEEATNAPLIFAGPQIQQNVIINKPAEMLSIYPTLIDLCGLPKNKQNEGISLKKALLKNKTGKMKYALTTYGWGNHSIRSEQFRYIHYSDSTEEFYDHFVDGNEWYNIIKTFEIQEEKTELQRFLPKENLPWAKLSKYDYNSFFRNDKLKH